MKINPETYEIILKSIWIITGFYVLVFLYSLYEIIKRGTEILTFYDFIDVIVLLSAALLFTLASPFIKKK